MRQTIRDRDRRRELQKVVESQRIAKLSDPCDLCEDAQAVRSCFDREVEVMRLCVACFRATFKNSCY